MEWQIRADDRFYARKSQINSIKNTYRGIESSYRNEILWKRRQLSHQDCRKISCRSDERFKSYSRLIMQIHFFAAKSKWTV